MCVTYIDHGFHLTPMAESRMLALEKVDTKQQFMEMLTKMNNPPKSTFQEGPEFRGRIPQLKTYILETNETFKQGTGEKMSWEINSTGIDTLKILHVTMKNNEGGKSEHEFYMDISNERFSLLHTNMTANHSTTIVQALANDRMHKFDHAWFYSDMLKKWIKDIGGFGGFTTICKDDNTNTLKLDVSGAATDTIQKLWRMLGSYDEVEKYMSYSAIDVHKGASDSLDNYINERISNFGYFSIKQGNSIENHLSIIRDCMDDYVRTIEHIEKQRFHVASNGNTRELCGEPFVISFENPVENIESFMDTIFSGSEPFKLWGRISKNSDGYYGITALDLHEGSSVDFEMTSTMMRVYLHENSCGNTLLRLLTNLQIHHDNHIKCSGLI